MPMGLCLSQAAICVYTGLVGSWVARAGSNPDLVRPDNEHDSRVLGLGVTSVLVAGLSIFNAVAAHAIGEFRFLFPADMPREKARLESWFTFGIPFTIITFGLVSVALSIVAIDLIRKHRGST